MSHNHGREQCKKTVNYNIAYLITIFITIPGNLFTNILLNFERFLYNGTMFYGQKSSNGDNESSPVNSHTDL